MSISYHNKYKDKPVIGIIPPPFINPEKNNYLYLNDGYIQYLKSLRLNILIIPYNLAKEKIDEYLKNIDAVFFSGARIGNYNQEPEFIKQYTFVDNILNKAIELNKNGRIFPVYASCHGIQSIIKTTEKQIHKFNVFKRLDAVNFKTKLEFIQNDSNNINKYKKFHNEIALHNCTFGITPKMFNKTKYLKNEYNIIAVGRDRRNKKFVDFIKHKVHPIYAFQCHPEKSITGLLDEYIETVFKSYNVRIRRNISTKKFKPVNIKYKTRLCKKLTPKVVNVHINTLKHRTRKNTKCYIIDITKNKNKKNKTRKKR